MYSIDSMCMTLVGLLNLSVCSLRLLPLDRVAEHYVKFMPLAPTLRHRNVSSPWPLSEEKMEA